MESTNPLIKFFLNVIFINDNKKYLGENYSTANIVRIWSKKTSNQKKELIDLSNKYFKKY